MLDARYVAEHLDEVRAALARRSAETRSRARCQAPISFESGASSSARPKRCRPAQRRQPGDEQARQGRRSCRVRSTPRGAQGALRPDQGAGREARRRRSAEVEERLLLGVRTCRTRPCPTARATTDNPVRRVWGEAAELRLRAASRTGTSATRSASSTSSARPSSRARASPCSGGRRAARARAHRLHARSAHARARLHRGVSAVPGEGRGAARHRPAAEVRGRICSRPGAAIRTSRARST